MLENEKKIYPFYRKASQSPDAEYVGDIRAVLYLSSDRRDEDSDGLCVYLKKTYYAVCDAADIRTGDTVLCDGVKMLVISVAEAGYELILHLESVEIIDTGVREIAEVASDV